MQIFHVVSRHQKGSRATMQEHASGLSEIGATSILDTASRVVQSCTGAMAGKMRRATTTLTTSHALCWVRGFCHLNMGSVPSPNLLAPLVL